MTEHVKYGTLHQERSSMYLKGIKMLCMQLLSTILMGTKLQLDHLTRPVSYGVLNQESVIIPTKDTMLK